MNNKLLRALIIEDSEYDTILLIEKLKNHGFEVIYQRVNTPELMYSALAKEVWDIVFSDYQLPQFSGLEALTIFRREHTTTPFIFVSGTLGEESAVLAMKKGANNFLMKNQLDRLIPIVIHELDEAKARIEHIKTQETLKQQEILLHQFRLQLAHADRISLMGEMASTLAHELSQPLTVIKTLSQMCVENFQKSALPIEKTIKYMNKILEQTDRASNVIYNIKNFVRKGKIELELLDINEVIKETLFFIQSLLEGGFRIQLHLILEELLPKVHANKIQVQQVILNLVRNSIEAIEEAKISKAKIIVQTKLLPLDQIEVSVMDNGPGFSKYIIEQLFDAYFTTKSTGTGMGLAICRSFIEAHGGKLTAQSTPNENTVFRFILPVN